MEKLEHNRDEALRPDRCRHGVRYPHECRDCQEEVPPEPIRSICNEMRDEAFEREQEDRSVGIYADRETAEQLRTWASAIEQFALNARQPDPEVVGLLREAAEWMHWYYGTLGPSEVTEAGVLERIDDKLAELEKEGK